MIVNWKECFIIIFVVFFILCLVCLLVYVVLIGFVVFVGSGDGFFNCQGLVFMGLYLLGIFVVFGIVLVFKYVLKSNECSILLLELLEYCCFLFCNVGLNVWEKVKIFVVEVGQVIFVIFMIFWVLVSYGFQEDMNVVVEWVVIILME